MIRLVSRLGVSAGLALSGCGGNGDSSTTADFEVRSALSRNTAPDVTLQEQSALADGNHQLSIDLYRETAEAGANYMLSALSIRTAFAMVYEGARGQTAQEMSDVLYFDADRDRLGTAMNALDLALSSTEMPADDAAELDAVELRLASAFWGQTDYPWRPSYLDSLATHYGAGIHALDFFTEPEPSRLVINDWVERRTNDRIVDLLPPNAIKSNTVAVLTNAVYFKAPWLTQFDTGTSQDFFRTDGSTVQADFMRKTESLPYAQADGWQAVELPYRGEALSMVILVPDANTFAAFDSSLDAAAITGAIEALTPTSVALEVPKFEFKSGFTLKDALSGLGMPTAFDDADLSGMVADRLLSIDEAYHKTFIAIDEDGTEAAAATAVVIIERGAAPGDVSLRLDRPFYFIIRDRATGVWLFFGRVLDPTAE